MIDMQTYEDLKGFCNRFSVIYVYGNNSFQRRIRNVLCGEGYCVEGHIVSDNMNGNARDTISLSDFKEKKYNPGKTGIVVAISDSYFNDIIEALLENGISLKDSFFVSARLKFEINAANSGRQEGDRIKGVREYVDEYHTVLKQCKSNHYNLLCFQNLGDTLMLLSMRKAFEEAYNNPLNYLIPIEQEDILKLYDIPEYSLVDTSKFLSNLDFDSDTAIATNRRKYDLFSRLFSIIPQLNTPFIAGGFDRTIGGYYTSTFTGTVADNLGIECKKALPPKHYDCISEDAQIILKRLGPYEKIVMIAPEARSIHMLPQEYWDNMSKEWIKKGFIVVATVMDLKNCPKSAVPIQFSLSDTIALGNICHKVVSLRSGLCDCLACIGEKLTVIYNQGMDVDYLSINNCFQLNERVNEIVK